MSPAVKKKPPPKHKKVAPANVKKKKPAAPKLTAAEQIYGKEKSPYKAIPQSRRGPGKLTGGHTITIQAWTEQLSVTCLLGENGGKITGGYGTWNQVAIPRDDPLTQWSGRGLFTMDLDLMLDAWHRQASIEPEIAKLEAMAKRIPGSLTPPALRLFGAVPLTGRKWVISGIDYGDALRAFNTGNRRRQELTLHLMEYREETDLQNLKGAAKAKPPRKYKVKKGDTLKSIAAKLLGKSSAWQQIVKLNKGLRGFKIPTHFIGKTILIPPAGSKPKHNANDGTKAKKNAPAKKKK